MWTTDKPVVDGWYWFRDPDNKSDCWPVEIIKGELWEYGILIDWKVQGEYQGPIKPEGV